MKCRMEKIFQFVLENLREFSLNILHFLGWCHTMTPCCRSIFFFKGRQTLKFWDDASVSIYFPLEKGGFPSVEYI